MNLTPFDSIDRLMSVEMPAGSMPKGIRRILYDAARGAVDEPLCLIAARALNEPPRKIGVITGACVPGHMPVGENDGPLGAVVLCHALGRIGHDARIYTDEEAAGPIQRLIEWTGAGYPLIVLRRGDLDQQEAIAAELGVAVTVEKLGGNEKNIMHGLTGVNRDHTRVNLDHLMRRMLAQGKTTIGIGDGGNEIGFGRFHPIIRERHPYGRASRNPEEGGVVCAVETTHTVVGTNSNWGAYAVAAALALLRGDASLAHTPEDETALIHMGVGLGLTDGVSGTCIPDVDGVPAETSAAAVRMLRTIVERSLADWAERDF